jgi:hypothetical protein
MWLYKILKKYRHGIDQRCISDHQCFYRFRKKWNSWYGSHLY